MGVADQVLTAEEMRNVTTGEAFILAGAFYLHDLGMAAGATHEGAKRLRDSEIYNSTKARLLRTQMPRERAELISVRHAARDLHAKSALDLAVEPVPGLGRYLIEDSDTRARWGELIGQVAASHHWSIPEVDRVLGSRGRCPDALGGGSDLGYVACLLRVIDFAHINMDRAPTLERLLRPNMPDESVVHWAAQEYITGPTREVNQLVFGATRAIQHVDGWWTFFEMVRGLDTEITAVQEYLRARSVSVGRFSLEGVKGAKTPQTFSALVPTRDFEPVDIRFRPDSMERLVSILGGRTLYGNDHYAPIRELLQNARDAVGLYQAHLSSEGGGAEDSRIHVNLEERAEGWHLVVQDNGTGMSSHVLTNYLLGIAADYWNSADYYSEHSAPARAGFRPVGRFGIGFLSVFMLGDVVEVETQRVGGQKLVLRLHGVGQRGALQKRPPAYAHGTAVRVRLSSEKLAELDELAPVVLAKAPMLEIPLTVTDRRGTTQIDPGWWKAASQEEISEFLEEQPWRATTPRSAHRTLREQTGEYRIGEYRFSRLSGGTSLAKVERYEKWVGKQPELLTDNCRIFAVPRLSRVLLCSKGFAVSTVGVAGVVGLVDIGEIELNAARSQALEWDSTEHRQR